MSELHLVQERDPPRETMPALPARVVVVSFRFRPDPDDIHGGQDAFVHGLVRALRARGVAVDVLGHRGRDDASQAIVEGARVHLLDSPFSERLTAHEAHQQGTWPLLEVMAGYSRAVEAFLPRLRRRHGGPLLILSHDVAEAGWVRAARRAGDRVVTFAHVLFSEFALADLTLEEFRRMHADAGFGLHVRAVAELMLGTSAGRRCLDHAARWMQRQELFGVLPGAARDALVGEHAAFVHSNHVLFPSALMREKAACRYRHHTACSVAPWAVDLSPAGPADREALRAELRLQPGDKLFVTLSRLSPDKRIDALLDAASELERRAPHLADRTVLYIAGRPTFLDDHRYAERLQAQARGLRRVRVHFAGFLRGARRTAALDLAATQGVFVQVGRYEAFGLGIAEALSRGSGVLTSDTDGARAILDPLEAPDAVRAAVLVRPRPEQRFSAALAEAMQAVHGRPAASPEDARRVAARFHWPATLAHLARITSRLAPAEPPRERAPAPRRQSSIA